MPHFELLETGRLDERESAFPSTIKLPDGTILCSYSIEGGQYVHGGTELSKSTDGGLTWERAGSVCAATTIPPSANCLKLSLSNDQKTLYAYGARIDGPPEEDFGDRMMSPIFCKSEDLGLTWSAPVDIPAPINCPWEISDRLLVTQTNRLIAPMTTLVDQQTLGEKVLGVVSEDDGKTWQDTVTLMQDPHGQHGYFEKKITRFPSGMILACGWTVTLSDYTDLPNSYVISTDEGKTWSAPRSTGIQGQTMTPLALSNNRLLVTYNRRFGAQGVVAILVELDDDLNWNILSESLIYDAGHKKTVDEKATNLQKELDTFAFGFPTPLQLDAETFLVTHWCVEDGVCGIRWTRLRMVD